MKHKTMRSRPPKTPTADAKPDKPEAAFDVWLNRSLHKMYDDVAQEPVPDDLLRLIEEDRVSREQGTTDET